MTTNQNLNLIVMTQEQLNAILSVQRNPVQLPVEHNKELSKLLSYEEVMKLFGIGRVTLWRWIKKGDIKCIRTRKLIYFEKDEIESFIKKRLG